MYRPGIDLVLMPKMSGALDRATSVEGRKVEGSLAPAMVSSKSFHVDGDGVSDARTPSSSSRARGNFRFLSRQSGPDHFRSASGERVRGRTAHDSRCRHLQ